MLIKTRNVCAVTAGLLRQHGYDAEHREQKNWGGARKRQWLWNEEIGGRKGLRPSSFKGHFSLTVYIEVASTNNENSWDLEMSSSFESTSSLIN